MDETCRSLLRLNQAFTIQIWLFSLKLIFKAKSEDVKFLMQNMEM